MKYALSYGACAVVATLVVLEVVVPVALWLRHVLAAVSAAFGG
jgi:hypothetical protein